MRTRRLTHLALGLTLIGTAACANNGKPGVLVNPLATDIVFGLVDKPPAVPAAAPVVRQVAGPVAEIPDLPEITVNTPGQFTGGVGQLSDCPEAALTEFPDEPASVTVKGEPKEGVYKFKRAITVTTDDGDHNTIKGFEDQTIRNVKRTDALHFTFERVAPNVIGEGSTIEHYLVNTNPKLLVDKEQGGRTIGVVPIPSAKVRVPEPGDEAGIFLTKIENLDTKGEVTSTFDPVTPVKYLPLDRGLVTPGQTWQSVSVDPSTGAVIVHNGTVSRVNRIDACGEIVEGWQVEAEQTINDVTYTLRYTIGTQFGGLFLGDVFSYEDGEGGKVQSEITIADLTPKPLPKTGEAAD